MVISLWLLILQYGGLGSYQVIYHEYWYSCFPVWMVRAGATSDLCEHQALLPLVLLDGFSLPHGLGWVLLLACPDHYYLATSQGALHVHLGNSLLLALACDCQLPFIPLDCQPAFTDGSPPGSSWFLHLELSLCPPPYPLRNVKFLSRVVSDNGSLPNSSTSSN